MRKAVLFPLGFIFLLMTVGVAPGQTSPVTTAINEAVLRQANTLVLRQKLADAKSAISRGDLMGAAKLYEDCYALVEQIGSGIDAETAQTISGLVATRLELARRAQSRGDLIDANTEVSRALKVDPQNPAALAFKRQNDQMIAAMKGKIPDTATLEQIPAVMNEQTDAATLVRDGKLLYEMGKLEEAEVKLNAALKLDPDANGAYYYLNLIKQARFAREDHGHTVGFNDKMVQVVRSWENPHPDTSLPTPNPYAWTNLVYTGPGRQAIVSKLDRIRLDNVNYEGLPLSEVVRNLTEQSKLRDPEKKGINFLISANVDTSAGAVATTTPAGGATAIDPATGLPVASASAAGAESVDIGSVIVKLSLTDVRLADLLDAIVEVADHPIKYSIRDYAIVFSAKGPESPQLYSRHFRVDPNTFYQGLQSVGAVNFGSISSSGSGGSGGGSSGGGGGGSGNTASGAGVAVVDAAPGLSSARSSGGNGGGGGGGGGGGSTGGGGLRYVTLTNGTSDISIAAKDFFNTLGVNLDPPKSIFFNDRLGELFVRATEQDLDTIENAIEVLDEVSPQIHIKARFIEVEQDDSKALGFDWYLGQFSIGGGDAVGSGGTSPSLTVPPSAANPTGIFPGNTPASVIAGAATDQLISGGLRNVLGAPAIGTITGILTDPNFRVVLHALEQRTGFETLAAPEVTTTSGRQTQMRATQIHTIITGFSFQQGAAATTTTGGATP
jgi:hypothetical protein